MKVNVGGSDGFTLGSDGLALGGGSDGLVELTLGLALSGGSDGLVALGLALGDGVALGEVNGVACLLLLNLNSLRLYLISES